MKSENQSSTKKNKFSSYILSFVFICSFITAVFISLDHIHYFDSFDGYKKMDISGETFECKDLITHKEDYIPEHSIFTKMETFMDFLEDTGYQFQRCHNEIQAYRDELCALDIKDMIAGKSYLKYNACKPEWLAITSQYNDKISVVPGTKLSLYLKSYEININPNNISTIQMIYNKQGNFWQLELLYYDNPNIKVSTIYSLKYSNKERASQIREKLLALINCEDVCKPPEKDISFLNN